MKFYSSEYKLVLKPTVFTKKKNYENYLLQFCKVSEFSNFAGESPNLENRIQ